MKIEVPESVQAFNFWTLLIMARLWDAEVELFLELADEGRIRRRRAARRSPGRLVAKAMQRKWHRAVPAGRRADRGSEAHGPRGAACNGFR